MFVFFSILVKIRAEIMFNDVLNIKEASLENKDFFKGVQYVAQYSDTSV